MERLPTAFAAQEERKKYREFLDFDTLTERLRNTNFVSIEFMGVNGEWRLARVYCKEQRCTWKRCGCALCRTRYYGRKITGTHVSETA